MLVAVLSLWPEMLRAEQAETSPERLSIESRTLAERLVDSEPRREPDLSGMRGMGGGGAPGYSVLGFPSRGVVGEPTELGVLRQSLVAGYPVWKADGQMVLVTASIRSTLYDTAAILPQSLTPIPEQLWGVSIGTMYRHQFDNGWSGSVMLNVGSASDRPFNTIGELNGTILAFLTVPTGERNSWLFSLMYSPIGEIPFPIPGIAYSWVVDESLQLSLGIPFRVTWKPLPEIYLEASYLPVTNVRIQSGWKPMGGPFTIFAGYEWMNEAYQLADRIEHKERFFSYAMQLSAGLRYDLPRFVSLELVGGYGFDRYLFIGRGFSDRNAGDRLDVEPGLFLGGSLRLRF